MIKLNPINAAVLLALGVQQPALAQSDDDEYIEEIITTGTRIVRTDLYDDAGHVVGMDEITIDGFAELNIADVLRSSPLNSHGSFVEQSGWTAQSNAFFDLRGLGSNRTLVLVDGMRVPGSPNATASSVNINLLPMAAVQRVDILADGASAVYGSDAMAGVVNLVLHRNFEGLEISGRIGQRDRDDGGDESLSILGGTRWDRGNVVFALEYSHRDPIFDRDRFYTATQVNDLNGDGRIDILDETVGVSYYGRSWEIFDPVTGHYELRAATDCPETNGFRGVMYTAAFGLPDDTICGYGFADVSANRAELEKFSAYVFSSYELSDTKELYARGMLMRNESFGRFAPPAANWPNPPADHPHNPFDLDQMIADGIITDQAELWAYYRWDNIGTRDSFVDDFQWDASVGLKGELTDRISFDTYVQLGRYTSQDEGRYFMSFVGLDYVLNNDLDPFSPEAIAAMRHTTWQDNFTDQQRAYGHMQIDAWDVFGAGSSIALVGAEFAAFEYQQKIDPLSEAGLVGGSAGYSNGGDRRITSAFLEYLLPVTDGIELNFAGRYDDYSDFGGTFTPSFGVSWRLTDRFLLSARWGEGFVAPNMFDLYGPSDQWRDFPYDPITDSEAPVEVYGYSNPELEPETSQSFSAGFNWEYFDGHSIDARFYSIDIDNVIVFPDAQSIVWADVGGEVWDPNGTRVVRVGDFIREIHIYTTNANRLEASGIDIQLSSSFDTDYGMFDLNLFYSHQLAFKENAFYKGSYQDTRNFLGRPDTRGQASVRWGRGDHSVSLVATYIGPHSTDEEQDFLTGVIERSDTEFDSHVTANLSYAYDAGRWGFFRIGANNVTDEDPALDPTRSVPATMSLYDYTGRVFFLEYRNNLDWF